MFLLLNCSSFCKCQHIVHLTLTAKYVPDDTWARSLVIFADLIVLLVTWYKTWSPYICIRRIRVAPSLAECLLRDGALLSAQLRFSSLFSDFAMSGTVYFMYVHLLFSGRDAEEFAELLHCCSYFR